MLTEMLSVGRIEEEVIAIIAMGGGFVIAIIWIITAFITNIVRTKAHEESRREISAYVAEGSITAEEGQRLIGAKPGQSDQQA